MLEDVTDYTSSEINLAKSALAKDANLSFYKVRATESDEALTDDVSYDFQDSKPAIKAFYNKYTGTKASCGGMRVREPKSLQYDYSYSIGYSYDMSYSMGYSIDYSHMGYMDHHCICPSIVPEYSYSYSYSDYSYDYSYCDYSYDYSYSDYSYNYSYSMDYSYDYSYSDFSYDYSMDYSYSYSNDYNYSYSYSDYS